MQERFHLPRLLLLITMPLCAKVIRYQHVINIVQESVNTIYDRPQRQRLFKYILDEPAEVMETLY
jgi:hypothetical protein